MPLGACVPPVSPAEASATLVGAASTALASSVVGLLASLPQALRATKGKRAIGLANIRRFMVVVPCLCCWRTTTRGSDRAHGRAAGTRPNHGFAHFQGFAR